MRSWLTIPVLLAVACNEPRAPSQGKVPPRQAMPQCPRGKFATELDAVLPPLEPIKPVGLFPVQALDRSIEPGCVVPFRKEPDERALDVGRVVARSLSRTSKGKPEELGRGRLEVGRHVLRLRLVDLAGDETVALFVEGKHVTYRKKGSPPFEADVSTLEDTPLPLPFDALVAALDKCDGDQRLGRTEDGNIIEARRGESPLWRTRWMDTAANAIVDTSSVCTGDDTRLLWRTAVGDCLPMIAVASVRSDRLLVIVRQGQSNTEDIMDYGFSGAR